MRGACIDPRGYDAGKKIKGKKTHVLVDTQGLLMHAIAHAADLQRRDGGALLMGGLFGAFPFLVTLYADGGYQGPEFQSAMKRILARVNVEIVKRSDQAKGFLALAQALDRRTHTRLARPLPETGEGLGMPQSQGARLPARTNSKGAKSVRMPMRDRLEAQGRGKAIKCENIFGRYSHI